MALRKTDWKSRVATAASVKLPKNGRIKDQGDEHELGEHLTPVQTNLRRSEKHLNAP